jgi:hypothetical protein
MPLKGYAYQLSYHAELSRSAAHLLLSPKSSSFVLASESYVYQFLLEL